MCRLAARWTSLIEKEHTDASGCHARTRQRSGRGPRRPENHRTDRRDHPAVCDLYLRQRPVAVPRCRACRSPGEGHEYVGVVEEVGSGVRTVKVGDFVVGSFWASDNTCEICRAGYQAYCVHRVLMGTLGTQAERARVPLADGTLVATPGMPEPDLIPSLMAASDVLGHRLVRRRRGRGRAGQDGCGRG
jgi:hypothetical protein